MESTYYIYSASDAGSLVAKLAPIILAFVLTTILGGLFTWWLQAAATARQARLELFRKRYDEGTLFLDALSTLIDRRHFALQRLMWAIADGSPVEKYSEREKEYFAVVVSWNDSLRSNRNKIRLLIGERQGDEFLDYSEDDRSPTVKSIHYQFVRAHRAVLQSISTGAKSSAQEKVTELNYSISIFLEKLTTEFASRANSLAIIEMPPPSTLMRGGPDDPLQRKA